MHVEGGPLLLFQVKGTGTCVAEGPIGWETVYLLLNH